MAKPLLLILTLTALLVAASAVSVTIYNPTTLPVDVVLSGDHPRDGAGYENDVVKVSTTIATVNLTELEQDIQIKAGEGHEVALHVRDGDLIVAIPDGNGDGGLSFKILPHPASLSVVPPGPK